MSDDGRENGKRHPKKYRTKFSRSLKLEKKLVYVDVIENQRGRALRVTELFMNRRSSVLIPSEAAEALEDALCEAMKVLVR